MKSPIITRDKVEADLSYEIMSFGLKFGTVACVLVGVVAVTCFISALVGSGPLAMLRGYVTAITGY